MACTVSSSQSLCANLLVLMGSHEKAALHCTDEEHEPLRDQVLSNITTTMFPTQNQSPGDIFCSWTLPAFYPPIS